MIEDTVDELVGCLEGFGEYEFNWSPIDDANRPFVLATHTMGNIRQNVLGGLCDVPVQRDRDAEFVATGDSPEQGSGLSVFGLRVTVPDVWAITAAWVAATRANTRTADAKTMRLILVRAFAPGQTSRRIPRARLWRPATARGCQVVVRPLSGEARVTE